MTDPALLAWDVGGAHLKLAVFDREGRLTDVRVAPAAVWQGLDKLDAALDALLAGLPSPLPSAVTMTAELVDLWPDRPSGVVGIADHLARRLGADRLLLYAGAAGFVPPRAAGELAERIASANWLATATALAGRLPEGLLVDIGSTTTDLVPFAGGRVVARGASDAERMAAHELVYTGVARTALMAVAAAVPYAGAMTPVMAEYFATTADVFRVLGRLPEGADLHPAADNGPKTEEASRRRLLRMVGRDLTPATAPTAVPLAAAFAEAQLRRIDDAARCVAGATGLATPLVVVGAGVGRFVARDLAARLGAAYRDLGPMLTDDPALADAAADCAPAVAVGHLALGGGVFS